MKRFYFEITQANILECVWADSFTEAKQKAAEDWLPYWDLITWINPDQQTEDPKPNPTMPVVLDD